MGTNYYWVNTNNTCPTCGHNPTERLHIGKSSAGWCFALHVIPDQQLNDWRDWYVYLRHMIQRNRGHIVNEYEERIPLMDLSEIVTNRYGPPQPHPTAIMRMNQAQPGPNNLWRSEIDGIHCIGHGKGTWDLITGEFS